MYKSRFAELVLASVSFIPQLRRFAACSGFRIEVPLRGTRGVVLSSCRHHFAALVPPPCFAALVLPPCFAALVPRSGTSMRNPLQAAKRRSCGMNETLANTCSAKRDLYIPLYSDKKYLSIGNPHSTYRFRSSSAKLILL